MQPQTLGRYQIVRELGRGAMGRVFLARDPQIQREVALKTVQTFASLPADEQAEALDRFLREARAAGKLSHPGIVTLFDVGEAEGILYLAMERVEGTTLDAFCRADRLLPVKTVCEVVAEVAETLQYAHDRGVVHRDIKPANLMRIAETSVKVMDFGLARAAEGQASKDGALIGTPGYMSPEQIRGEPVDGRSDLFSLAIVLFEMLTGERPFPGDSIPSILYRIVHEPVREAGTLNARVGPALDDFLRRALAKRREDRYACGSDFAQALRAAGAQLSGSSSADVSRTGALPCGELPAGIPPASSSRHPKSSARPWILGATLLALLLAGAGYAFRARLAGLFPQMAKEVWLETRVRTEPAGLPVLLDGRPLDLSDTGLIRFPASAPLGLLSTESGCRVVQRRLDPADSGGEVVLVVEPSSLVWRLDPGVSAVVSLNGEALGPTPIDLELDLCRANRLELEASGYHPVALEIEAQATPMKARTGLASLELRPIPRGRLVLPQSEIPLVVYVDGTRVGGSTEEMELPEGRHELRLKNETYWIDVRQAVEVRGGEKVEPSAALPPLTTLVVQAFPANCKVFLRRPGGTWKYVDDTPARRRIAVGRYELRVTLKPTGESREREIELEAGENPPVRISFGAGS